MAWYKNEIQMNKSFYLIYKFLGKLWAQQCDFDPTLDQFFNKIVVTNQIEEIEANEDDDDDAGFDYDVQEFDDDEVEEDENDNEEGSGQVHVRRSLFNSRRIRNNKTHASRGKRQTAVKQNTPYLEWEYEGQCSATCGDGLVKQVRKCKPFCDVHWNGSKISKKNKIF